ncbi:DUF418 domain-containing protein [Granulicella sp. L60]|uniref:DUF418 domain-containing protein n=1 Tax=Granulicella sp. L60 TaxID=1641866 RepID=UPI00131DF4F0|nr:DUF418 domain-containing protein [Granulicella sp. L60]
MSSIATSSPSETYLPVGTNEELAGPPHIVSPIRRTERISSIDTLRGFALLGILVLNMDSFGGPEFFHDIPIGLPKPAFTGPHAHLNLIVLFIKWIFFEGKMRFLFSMLFGAGVVLLTERAERRGAADQSADIFLRRNMWLVVFGLIHGTFIWSGDILMQYGLTAILCLYPCRRLRPKTLFTVGTFLLLVVSTYGLLQYTGTTASILLSRKHADVIASQKAGNPLTPEQKKIEQQWAEDVKEHEVTQQGIDQKMADARTGYIDHLLDRGVNFEKGFASRPPTHSFGESAGIMLIGMGLYKTGFFAAELSFGTYLWTALLGFLISTPLYVIGLLRSYQSGFDFATVEKWLYLPYRLAEWAGGLAIAAALLAIIKSGILRKLLRPVAAVGQTAFSNYILTSLICQFVFFWGPWKLYGRMEYYQTAYVIFGVWAVNLILSPLWLQAFEFGPLEWLWRSATYWKLQPMWKRIAPR